MKSGGQVEGGILVVRKGQMGARQMCRAWRAQCVREHRPYVCVRRDREGCQVELDLTGMGVRLSPAETLDAKQAAARYSTARSWVWWKPALVRVDGVSHESAESLAQALLAIGVRVLQGGRAEGGHDGGE